MIAVENAPAPIDDAVDHDDATLKRQPQCIAERIFVAIICAPLSLLFGWFFFILLTRGTSPSGDWVTLLVGVFFAELVAALFFVFTFAAASAITGRDRFDQLLYRRLGRLALVTFIIVTIIILMTVI